MTDTASEQADNHTPPGWKTNPSDWGERIPIVLLALVGFLIASYLGAFQLGFLDTVWEPFFGDDSRTVLTSGVSEILPIPDGVLGAMAYLIDTIAGIIGGRSRWRTMPWIVVIFGLAVGPLGAVSIILVILQPVMFDSWCTLCLASAAISLLMIGPALDELLVSLQYLKRVQQRGGSIWLAFWGMQQSDQSADGRQAQAEVG